MIKAEALKVLEDAGAYFANFATKGAAMIKANGGDPSSCGRMCDDCAFKKGTAANTEAETLLKMESALIYEIASFNCHTDKLQDAGIPCAGFQFAKHYIENK